ncbi:MAG: hypothetical protein ACYC99_15365 [Candidatus Geothermincolia bacterium]
MKKRGNAPRPVQYAVLIFTGLAGVVLLCWGVRVAMTTVYVGFIPGALIAFTGAAFLVIAAYGWYVVDFKGKGGVRAFALRMTSAALAGFCSMLLARVLFR